MKRFLVSCCFCFVVSGFAFAGKVYSDEVQANFPEALAEEQPNWYDTENDAFLPLDVDITEEPASYRDSDWVSNSAQQNAPNPPTGSLGLFGSGLQMFFVIIVVLIIAAVLAAIAWLILTNRDEPTKETPSRKKTSSDLDRIEALPFKVRRPDSDFLTEARRHYEAGEFQEAIIYLFSYQLVELDKHNHIRLTKGKTNRQYLRELGRRNPLNPLVHSTILAFEDVFFGHHSLSREQFEACWQQLDSFHQNLQQKQEPANATKPQQDYRQIYQRT